MLVGTAYNGRDGLVLCCDNPFHVTIVLGFFSPHFFHYLFSFSGQRSYCTFLPFLFSSVFALAEVQSNRSLLKLPSSQSFVSLNQTLTCRARSFLKPVWRKRVDVTNRECLRSSIDQFRYVEQSECVLIVCETGLSVQQKYFVSQDLS